MDSDARKWVAKEGTGFLTRIGLKEGQAVLDFGCNEGNYAKAAARVAGPSGKVYALDKDRKALNKLKRKAGEENLGNIECLCGSEDGEIPVAARSVDVVLLYDVLHRGYFPDAQQRSAVLRNIHRVLKPGGVLSLYPTHLKEHRMTFQRQIREVEQSGFRLQGESRMRLVHDGSLVRGRVFTFRKQNSQPNKEGHGFG